MNNNFNCISNRKKKFAYFCCILDSYDMILKKMYFNYLINNPKNS